MTSRISALWGLKALPDTIPWDEFDYGMVESPADICFLSRDDLRKEASQYTEGLAFGEHTELRWLRRSGGLYHLVYLNDQGRIFPGAMRDALLTWLPEAMPDCFLLWSEQDGRIPKAPEYPRGSGPAAERKCVTLRHYEIEGCCIYRCVALQPWRATT